MAFLHSVAYTNIVWQSQHCIVLIFPVKPSWWTDSKAVLKTICQWVETVEASDDVCAATLPFSIVHLSMMRSFYFTTCLVVVHCGCNCRVALLMPSLTRNHIKWPKHRWHALTMTKMLFLCIIFTYASLDSTTLLGDLPMYINSQANLAFKQYSWCVNMST